MKILRLYFSLIAMVCLTSTAWSASAISFQVGSTQTKNDWSQQNIDFAAHYWYQWDQMVFFGLGSGVQQYGDDKYYPALTSMLVRLPIGRTILPVATGEWGYLFGPSHQFTWKLGGGLDMKLGNDSSIILMSGFQKFNESDWESEIYTRLGVLLEF